MGFSSRTLHSKLSVHGKFRNLNGIGKFFVKSYIYVKASLHDTVIARESWQRDDQLFRLAFFSNLYIKIQMCGNKYDYYFHYILLIS